MEELERMERPESLVHARVTQGELHAWARDEQMNRSAAKELGKLLAGLPVFFTDHYLDWSVRYELLTDQKQKLKLEESSWSNKQSHVREQILGRQYDLAKGGNEISNKISHSVMTTFANRRALERDR
jgi:hypothetical protein